ncbi:MAG: alpha/beta fold hydrolase, partial [Thiothrix sp.]
MRKPLVLLHGWGMNSRVWQPVLPLLQADYAVVCLDLPGHGANNRQLLQSLPAAVTRLGPQIPHGAVVVGWSLGGLLAQSLAYALPEKVAALVMVASTPKFVAEGAWQHGVSSDLLAAFGRSLQSDYLGTVKRFFALQFLGTKTDTRIVNALREAIMQQPASLEALHSGLQILRSADFTQQRMPQPTLWLLGKLDKLIPATLADV